MQKRSSALLSTQDSANVTDLISQRNIAGFLTCSHGSVYVLVQCTFSIESTLLSISVVLRSLVCQETGMTVWLV